MNRYSFAHVCAWLVMIVTVISTLPSDVQRELQATLQRLEVPALSDAATDGTQYGRATAFVYVVGFMLLHAVERLRTRIGHVRVQMPRDQPAVNGQRVSRTAAELERNLAAMTTNRNSQQRAYVREFIKRIFDVAILKKDFDDEREGFDARIKELEAVISKDRRQIATLQTKITTNRATSAHMYGTHTNHLLGTITVQIQKYTDMKKEIAQLEARYAKLKTAYDAIVSTHLRASLALNALRGDALVLEEESIWLKTKLAELEDERDVLHVHLLHEKERMQQLQRNAQAKRNALNRSRRRESNLASAFVSGYSPRQNIRRPNRGPNRALQRTASM